jgi:D-alanyl-D-alanine dipeptidase
MTHNLVNIHRINERIRLDIRYATKDNFIKEVIYTHACCFVHRDIADRLDRIQKELEAEGLGLKIFDGYRPMAAAQKMWDLVKDPRFVSPPDKGPRHSRGTAVDVTLVDEKGEELAMPTLFDEFSERAYADYDELPREIIENRDLLQEVMVKHGFKIYPYEWWHFDLQGYEAYPVIDTDFETLLKLDQDS